MASRQVQARPVKQSPHFDPKNCHDCRNYPLPVQVIKHYLHDLTENKDFIKNDFAKKVNSFLNCQGGIIIVPIMNGLGNMDLLNQKICSRLDELLQDDAIPNSVYNNWHHADHIVFRVRPQPAEHSERIRMPSIYNFHTITSLMKGCGRITNVKLARLLKVPTTNKSFHRDLYSFREGEDVYKLDKAQNVTNIPFVEGTYVQAKEVPEEKLRTIKTLGNYMWSKSKDFVTAFSKSAEGGSVFFGVKENSSQQKVSANCVTKSVMLKPPDDLIELSQELCNQLNQSILWLGPESPQNPIDIEFHKASPNPDTFVIEVRVNFYNGVCFTDREGPELYLDDKRVLKDKWLEWFRKSFDIPNDRAMQFFHPEFEPVVKANAQGKIEGDCWSLEAKC